MENDLISGGQGRTAESISNDAFVIGALAVAAVLFVVGLLVAFS